MLSGITSSITLPKGSFLGIIEDMNFYGVFTLVFMVILSAFKCF
jgi:hypothetical protein